MRALVVSALLLMASCAHRQQRATAERPVSDTTNTFSFTARFSKAAATKDGYYVGPYVVEMNDSDAQRFDGRKVRITGTYFVVEALDHQPVRTDEHGDTIIIQGRAEDTGHIVVTGIELVPE